MKNQIKHIAILLLSSVFVAACTDNFESMNTAKGSYTEDKQLMDDKKYTMYFNPIQQGIYFNDPAPGGTDWTFQTIQNLNADMFSGYFHDMASQFFGSNSCYNLNPGWTADNWDKTYSYTIAAINKSEKVNKEDAQKHFLGLTRILKVATLHRITDQYGPIIYSDLIKFTPNSQQEVYTAMFADLDLGMKLVDEALSAKIAEDALAGDDILTKAGNRTLSAWMRWANSLRLRLAIHVSNIDKNLAKTQAEKAFADKYGLITTNDQSIEVSTEKGYRNPLGTIGWSWMEVYANASMESFLVGYEDPRATKYFTLAVGGNEGLDPKFVPLFDYTGTIKGIPMGLGASENNPDKNEAYKYHSRCQIITTSPAPLMTAAEVWFLRAEAALRGFSTENAKTCYETGVNLSFEQWGATGVSDYLASEARPSDYKDVYKVKYNMPAVSTISPKWNDAATNEIKLERIITQKWLAMYPEGAEAWTEQRRTGYPKLFKVITNDSQGKIDTDIMIRRLPFPANLQNDSPELYQQLVGKLNGADTGGTRLWWDAGKNNF